MDINLREGKNQTTIMDILGEIDLYEAPKLKREIDNLIQEGNCRLIINLKKVSYIDSMGIGVLIYTISELKKKQGALKVYNLHKTTKKIFELTRLIRFFMIYSSEEEAVESFASEQKTTN